MAKTKIKRGRLDTPPATGTPPPPNYGARASTAKECKTCGHSYIRPCIDEKMLAKCPNARWLKEQKGKKKDAAKAR